MKICPAGVELFHVEERIDKEDELNKWHFEILWKPQKWYEKVETFLCSVTKTGTIRSVFNAWYIMHNVEG